MKPICQPDPLERIVDALEAISSTLDSVDRSLEVISDVLADSQVKGPRGSAIAVAGNIQQI
ncbi:hypothetical protein [Clostridium sp. FS41]|jgi:hypothetical protein|uniref:hypothetical protein n=1 Tax=Clostridium sp. FS41 TaxID=1609975 RepID=UPI0005D3A6E5|nr:hypothetical protein [Clostridium sp. FS41]KJJ71704.1 hypothetical protein CLFS41_23660 [Clostridium sp. FS41]